MIKGVLKRATALLLALSIIISLLPELTCRLWQILWMCPHMEVRAWK